MNVKLDKKSLFDELDLLVFVVFALEPEEATVLLTLEPEGLFVLVLKELLVLVDVLESETWALDTESSSELIGTQILELSESSDCVKI